MKTQFNDYSEIVNCLIFTATYSDFDEGHNWQSAYFELLSWKNTWNLCYDLDILSSRKGGAFVRIVTKKTKDMKERMLTALDELGYRNVSVDEIKARVFDAYDIWPEDFDNEVFYYFPE